MEPSRDLDVRAVVDGSFAFKALTADERASLAAAATSVRYAADDVIIREDEEGLELLLIVDGRVRVSTLGANGDLELAELGPGAIVGEVAVLTKRKRTSTVAAADAVTAISFPADAVRAIAEANPAFKKLMQRLVEGRALHTISVIPPTP
jgi:CRP-like cAMP-binding protein